MLPYKIHPLVVFQGRLQLNRVSATGFSAIATGADIFKWMLGRLYTKLPPEFKMVLPIHDAILFEIPENRMEEAKQLIREIMQESPPKFTIPLVANIHVGKNWKECQG